VGSDADYPFALHLYLSGLLSDGRGASLPWLQGSPDPMTTLAWQTWVEMHPDAARKLRVKDGDVVRVTSPVGEIEALVYTYPAIRPDTIAIPVGQGHTDNGRYAQDRGDNPMNLVASEATAAGGLPWASMRVKVAATGQRIALASFESRIPVTDGFATMAFPG
jgi:hypothetical protein